MKDQPSAIRRAIVNVGEKSWNGASTRRPAKKVESTCRSGPASFDDKVEWPGEGTCADARTTFPRTSER